MVKTSSRFPKPLMIRYVGVFIRTTPGKEIPPQGRQYSSS